MINRDAYLSKIIPNEPLYNTSPYARVERAVASTAWRAVLVYHLLPEENGNQHIVFVDALDTGGRWADVQGMTVGWTWEGRRTDTEPAPPRPFEKNPPEPRAQVDLYARQVTSVWLQDSMGVPSDVVHGLRSDVQDVPGNNLYHNSFVVLFQLMTREIVPPVVVGPGPDAPTVTLASLAARVMELEAWRWTMEGDGR